jgi:hypothetical protein
MHAGVLKTEDTDGSIIKSIALRNPSDSTLPAVIVKRESLIKTDGLMKGNLATFKQFNIDLNFFNETDHDSLFFVNNGGWAAVSGSQSGTKGPTPENRVLIAQLTTNGDLSFDLNVQIGTPTGGVIKFVSKNADAAKNEVVFKELTYPAHKEK